MFQTASPGGADSAAQPLAKRLRSSVGHSRNRSFAWEIGVGMAAGLFAAAVRWFLPLEPQQLPTITVVIMLAITTTLVGVRAGIATALVGGTLAWYLFFNPLSWSLRDGAWITLLGFGVIASVILTTAHLYRRSEQLSHDREISALEERAANADLFAREMGHRLKNALAIVQSIAFQTIGRDTPEATKFAGRVKALAEANDLLSEHVSAPTASVPQVIGVALRPFDARGPAFHIESVAATISGSDVVTLSLALHELATNAVKYGALSRSDGKVLLKVEDAQDCVRLTWQESGGPKVRHPEKKGFGTRLLLRSGVDAKLDFESDGLRCSFSLRKS
jgi:two-component sensor histidine kinase